MFSKKNMTLVCVVGACLFVCFFARVAAAQGSGVPASFFGTVTNVTALPGTPPGSC
jgi:Na+-transporting NADH:ubiquinone oxidoreductase subunit NqrE